ncbi:flavin reductase family protein [Massilia agilis]|uniref:Flavin reductase family protein n=1 Tax=Massilia agilis TaxID=1811226 RepID=A0ABT2D5Z6_9BURK|nr:flavin reductase family protein [Massilia agilis]MCS0806740.1 flavin reductase family protein [Massilia agilis]
MTISLSTSQFQPTEMYFLLRDSVVPRPIAWVSTVSADGAPNIAPFSFFNVVSPYPPVLGFSCGPRGDNHAGAWIPKDTYTNILATREFVVNIVPEQLMDEMVRTAADLAPGDSEFRYAGLAEAPSAIVKPPRVARAPVAYECKLYDIVDAGANKWIMGSVEYVHIDEAVYVGRKGEQDHRIDLLERLETRPVGRLGRANYVRVREVETRLRRDGPNS